MESVIFLASLVVKKYSLNMFITAVCVLFLSNIMSCGNGAALLFLVWPTDVRTDSHVTTQNF